MKKEFELSDDLCEMISQMSEAWKVSENEIIQRGLYTLGIAVGAIKMDAPEPPPVEEKEESKIVVPKVHV